MNPDKIFTITFNQELQKNKDYSKDILITSTMNNDNRILGFTTKVDSVHSNKLLIIPNTKWDEGTHHLTINKNLQNSKSVSLTKDIRMKFNVISDFKVGDIQSVKNYKSVLEASR